MKTAIVVAVLVVIAGGCAPTIPKEALALSPQSLAKRQIQTRRFDTPDEQSILSASAALLQDLGFNLDEAAPELGLLLASKDRSAVEAGQVAAAVAVALLTGVSTPTDKNQKFRASVVTRPVGENAEGVAVRVTFQRIVWNTKGQVSRRESLDSPEAYQEFFEKLSKAVFLEAHEL
jgi:hypothetical protein